MKKAKGQMVLEFLVVYIFVGLPCLLGLIAIMVHNFVESAATADTFLEARAALYGNSDSHCKVSKFLWGQQNPFKAEKLCTAEGRITVTAEWIPFLLDHEKIFAIKKAMKLKKAAEP